MKFDETFLSGITNCLWLKRCGYRDEFDFSCAYVDSVDQLKRNIDSDHWVNLCLDKGGDFTSYLCLNHRREYRDWNDVVEKIKKDYISVIAPKIEDEISHKNLPVNILGDIKFNLVTLFMVNYYSEYYKDEFWDQMLTIYLSVHIPCDYNNGFVVY